MGGQEPAQQAVPQAVGQTPQHPGHCQGALWFSWGHLCFECGEEETEAFVVIYEKTRRALLCPLSTGNQPIWVNGEMESVLQQFRLRLSPLQSPTTVAMRRWSISVTCCGLCQIWKNSDLLLSNSVTAASSGTILGQPQQQPRFMRRTYSKLL